MAKHNPYKLSYIFLFFAVTLFMIVNANDIKSEEYYDSLGKDHWLTFIPNWHNNISSNYPEMKYGDSLYIFITCNVPTNGNIAYFDSDGKEYSHDFEITDPDEIYTFALSWFNFELRGYNNSGMMLKPFPMRDNSSAKFSCYLRR